MEKIRIDDFDKNGYLIVKDKEIGLSIKNFTQKIISSLKKQKKEFNISDEKIDLIKFISNVTLNEQENSVSSKIYEFLPTLPEVYQFSVNKKLTFKSFYGLD